MWNTLCNIFWFLICMVLLMFVIIMCVAVDLIVTVIDFFKRLFTKNTQHN